MIFNPYDLHFVSEETAQAASHLSWAKPLLQDNMVLVGLVLFFLVADLLAVRVKGVLRYQFSWLTDTRSARTFESTAVVYPWLKPLLLVQVFLFFGLTLYCVIDPAHAEHLNNLDVHSSHILSYCIAVLLGWYLWQTILVNWFCYLFGIKDKRSIMNRSHVAIFAVLAPLSMLMFMLLMAGLISIETVVILLASLFILSQIGFIFNGIKIFYEGLGSLLLIFVYLCTLEIAPLLVIWAKITI